MYRGRPPPRGGYPPAFVGRGLPPPRPYLAPGYRDDRNRPRLPYHPGYQDHGHPDSYRRSPPHRRQPSPGAGSQRGGGHWAGGPPRESSPSPRRPIPLDHNLVITVGNELTGSSGSTPSRHHDRDHPPGPEYEQSWSRGRSRDHSPDRSQARSRTKSRGRSQSRGRSPDRSRARSRGRSRGRSPDRSRARSRGQSRDRSPDWRRARSRGQSRDRSPDWNRARSRGRSKSRARSKSRPRSRSRTRSQSRGRSRGQSHGQSYSKGVSHGRSKSWQRSRSCSRSPSAGSSSSSDDDSDEKNRKEFKELQTARRRKELQEMMSLPTKSILKKRNDSEDSPSLRSSDSPRCLDGANMSRVVDQLLLAVRGLEPHMVASMLSELRSDPQMAQRAGLDAEIKEILNLLGGRAAGAGAQEEAADDIDDEEKFLYGDSEEPKPLPASDPVRLHGLDLYGDVTEETLYGDYPPQTYDLPPGALPHLQAPPATGEMDVRFTSRPAIGPDQNITVQVSNPACPPGMEPLQESERQALEEYEKIQDLLKTIGLDLGVAEISKMAARTKERLHGNKPPPRTPTCSRRYSSSSSDGSRRHRRLSHSSSSSSSRSRSGGRGGSWSSDDGRRKNSAPPRSHRDAKEAKGIAAQPPQNYPKSSPLPPHPGAPIPTYPPSQVHSMMPPSYPSPGYGQYGNYLPYMHQQWPPMYPPPSMSLPPDGGPEQFPPALNYERPYNPAAPVLGATGVLKSCVQNSETGKVSSHDRRVSEEQNNESQKQKVLGERGKLRQEREIRMKKKECLMKKLERLRKQQGELLRKKRREKGGHKDPLLQEISHLQEEVMAQISNLRKEHEAAEKKCTEIDKVALILGLSPSDRPCRTSKPSDHHEDEPLQPPPPEKRRREPERSPEGSVIKASAAPPVSVPAPPPAPPPDPFEYYDAGNHWCKNCNVTSGSMFDFFTHLHSKTHRKTLDPYDRPWVSTPTKIIKTLPAEEKLTKPAKGSEFLLPVRGFFCLLCKQFYGDAICAEEHVTTHPHNEKYKKQMYENPLYEQRRNLDRQAGLVSETSGKKRKHEDDEKGNKDKEEKSKHKKEKRDKENKTEEDDADQKEEKSKVKKEEKQRTSKKEEESKDARSLEEEWPSHGQKDEDEKSKNSKKEDKYRHSREEEERGKYSRRDEDDRYKYSRVEEHRSRYRRDEHDRHDEQPKYGLREEEDKNKSSKYSDFRPTYDRERDEGKPKADKEAVKKLEPAKPAGKPEVSKPEPPPKPYDPPKILCGPSPAMRAKLRKQSLETSKPASTATTSSFGKFTWKKREDILAKEAEKVAAEFIKDDEAAANQNPVSVEDSFAKSMAVAKEIAEKLSGQQSTPSPPVSNRGRIRPNLPAPAAVLRKTTTTSKPAPLNTFLSIRPQSAGSQVPPAKEAQAFPGPLTNTLNAQSSLLESKLQTPVGRPDPSEARPTPPVSNSAPPGSNSAPPEIKPATPVSNSAPSEVKPAPPTMIRIVSDVAAPGVPESEQTHTVFVKPPPLMTMSIGPQKSAKPRSNLAAAKAQDLFGIFYSSISQPGTSSITKPATDARGSTTNKSQPPSLETQKPQPQRQPFTHSEPPTVVCTSPQVNSVHTPSSQTQPQSDLHIASVWSLQSTPPPTREVAASKTPSETAQTILSPPAQSEAQILPQNHSPTPESESRNVPQAEPALLEPTPETLSQPNLTSQNEAQQPTKPQPDQDTQTPSHPETPPDTVSLAEPQASPKTRGKTTPAKRNPPALRPVRQTRSQTRQQQQSQSESEPEPASADSDSAGSDPKGLDMSDVGSALHPGEEAPGKGDPQMMGLIPETLGLPSDMTSLDFETDFNFE